MKQIITEMEKVKVLADKAGLCPSPKFDYLSRNEKRAIKTKLKKMKLYERRNSNYNQNRDGSGEEPSLLYTQYDCQQGSAKTETRRPCDLLRTTRIL